MNKEDKALVHIYCGDGKGKTTAATGLAIRMAGYGKKVLFARFLKNERSGELKILDQIKEIEVLHLERSFGFYNQLDEKQKEEWRHTYKVLWKEIQEKVKEGKYDLLVMDEFLHAMRYELVTEEEILKFLQERPKNLEVVMTGRDPSQNLLKAADYVSEIKKVKHPYDEGIFARKGIEY